MNEFEKWFKKAESDFKTIKLCIVSDNPPCDTCCFHAQQTAEKYLKAYLVANSIYFKKTNDLIELLETCCKKNLSSNQLKQQCDNLTDYGVSPRYPDELDDLTFEDTQKAYSDALIIKNFV